MGFANFSRFSTIGHLLHDADDFVKVRKGHGFQLGVDLVVVDLDFERGSASNATLYTRTGNGSLELTVRLKIVIR